MKNTILAPCEEGFEEKLSRLSGVDQYSLQD